MAVATVILGIMTSRSVKEAARTAAAAQAEADASLLLVEETRKDREMEVRPVLTLGNKSGTVPFGSGGSVPGLRLRNIGRGPALTVRVVQYLSGEVFWSEGLFQIPAGEDYPHETPATGPEPLLPLTDRRGFGVVEPSLFGSDPDNVAFYCRDQLGNGLRFRPRTGEPPDVWRRGDTAPAWSTALSEPFDWRPVDRREGPLP
ncbi:MAG: hypothetical protein ACREN2_02145 [Candidatus Dormibacteria bacterium]